MMKGWDAGRHALAAQAGGTATKGKEATLVFCEHHRAGDDIVDVLQRQMTEDIGPAGPMVEGGTRAFFAIGKAGHRLDCQRLAGASFLQRSDHFQARPDIRICFVTAVRADEDCHADVVGKVFSLVAHHSVALPPGSNNRGAEQKSKARLP